MVTSLFRLLLLSSCLNELPVGSILGCHLSNVHSLPKHCKIITTFIPSSPQTGTFTSPLEEDSNFKTGPVHVTEKNPHIEQKAIIVLSVQKFMKLTFQLIKNDMSSKLQQTNNTKERELFTKLTIKGGSPENYREENNQEWLYSKRLQVSHLSE